MSRRQYKWKPLPPKKRRAILERDNYECQVCGKQIGMGRRTRRAHVHHRRGHKGVGANARRYLTSLCASCHALVTELAGNSKALALDEGLLRKAVLLALEHIKAMESSSA